MFRSNPALATLLLASVSGAQGALVCNGDPNLCDRRFNEVAYATTHNAHANAEDGFFLPLPNQKFGIATQLGDGIRGLMLDTYDWFGGSFLCHGSCFGGATPLADGLADIRAFLDANPNEVVAIIFESYLSESDTAAAFASSGLLALCYAHTPGAPWPTLRDMIEANQRCVVFTDDSAASLPWHHYVWDYAWETHFSFDSIDAFSCTENRGTPPNDFFILNHFVTGPLGAVEGDAPEINDYFELFTRSAECWGYEPTNPLDQIPNFVTVDHYDDGHVFETVAELNRIWPAPPLWATMPPLSQGQSAQIAVFGAVPGELVFFVFGLSGLGFGPCFPIGEGLCVELIDPLLSPIPTAIANFGGIALLGVTAPSIPSLEVGVQAFTVDTGGQLAFRKSVAISRTIF